MNFFQNIAYQSLFTWARPHTQRDLEKGQGVAEARDSETQEALAADASMDGPPSDQQADDESDIMDDDDNIANESDHGEHNPRRLSTVSSSVSGSSRLSTWWSRTKDLLNTDTLPSDLDAFVPHYRHLPILSGVIIPFSILLEIPGLTEDWYVRTEDHKTVERRPNTMILDLGLAFSIAFAVLANISLITRFLERKVKLMTIACIMFLTIHDIINIATVTIFGVEHRFDDGFTYGQAFWMTICSTSVSTVTNVTLIIDLILTPDFDTSGSGLTRKQRTLVISVMALMTYIALGALIETFLISLSFLDALYFVVVSIETIGFGDIVPVTTGSRVFTCLYSVFGIVNLALTVGLARETVLESIEIGYRKRAKAVRARRRKFQYEHRVGRRWRAAIEWRLHQMSLPVWVPDERPGTSGRYSVFRKMKEYIWPWPAEKDLRLSWFGTHMGHTTFTRGHPKGMHLNLESLDWAQLETAAMEAGVPLCNLLPEGFRPNGQVERRRRGKEAYRGEDPVVQSNDEVRDDGPDDLEDMNATLPLTHARLGRMILMLHKFAHAVDNSFADERKQKESNTRKPPFLTLAAENDAKNGPRKAPHPARKVGDGYADLREKVDQEERKAFFVRLAVVWVIFLLFWMVGSVVFMTTEKWSFGQALYFCVIAFTTIGYGDMSPKTQAGRSVFIFWALLGVGTMTILISIVSEAYSSRYKDIFRSGIIAQTIKQYQQRARGRTQPRSITLPTAPESADATTSSSPPFHTILTPAQSATVQSPTTTVVPLSATSALDDTQKRAMGQLEALPGKIIYHAKTFGEDVQYLIKQEATLDTARVPDGLKQLMDDVAGVERLGERIKEEILADSDARNALLAISIENAIRKMMEVAEEAIEAMRERDRYMEEHQFGPNEDVYQTGREVDLSEASLHHRSHTQSPKPDD